jgi:hypothetical protein
MNTQINKMIISSLILVFGIGASAGTRLCYVQEEDAGGIYKNALAQKTIDVNDYQNHILFQDGDMMYTGAQSELNGKITVAMFNRTDNSTLVMAVANGNDGITLINVPTKKLIGCTAVTK